MTELEFQHPLAANLPADAARSTRQLADDARATDSRPVRAEGCLAHADELDARMSARTRERDDLHGMGLLQRARIPSGAAPGQENASVFGEILGLLAEDFREHVELGAIEMPEAG